MAKFTDIAAECGLVVERVTTTGKHPKMYVVAPDGRRGVFSMPRSASDHRAMLNKRAQLRAFAQDRHAGSVVAGRHVGAANGRDTDES